MYREQLKTISQHPHFEITPPSLRVFCNSKAKDLHLQNVSRTIETIKLYFNSLPSLRVFCNSKAQDLLLQNVSRTTKTYSHHRHVEYFIAVKPKIYICKMYREL